ncbi:calcium-binding protein [Derxia gummosa]|uniref:Calcium-binding protein n=1 Tax=Derxia gummosa DSM 723 TaxID=1121388 RepID=A0A8B6X4P2_9BURK|nr:calcium-binding protein [Derxia gummosa]
MDLSRNGRSDGFHETMSEYFRWLRQVGDDLAVSVIGTGDRSTFQNRYPGSQYRVEAFETVDGTRQLLASQVNNLVQAMPAFTPPPSGQTTLSPRPIWRACSR